MTTPNTVYIVDDDEAVRDALTMLLESVGHGVKTFSSAREFLDFCSPGMSGCVILDVSMPGMDGPALQEELLRRSVRLPIIFLTGHGTIPTTVRTIKAGALDFLSKPVEGKVLLARVRDALEQSAAVQEQEAANLAIASRLATLSQREREVMALAVAGYTSKDIAHRLAISFRTVEIHRAHIMQKTGATNILELARFAAMLVLHQSS